MKCIHCNMENGGKELPVMSGSKGSQPTSPALFHLCVCACVFFLSLFLYIIIGLGNRQQFHYDVIWEEIAHHWVTPPQRIKWEVSSNKVNSALTEGSIAEPLISVPHPAPAPLLPPPPPPLPSAPHFLAPHLSFILSSLPSVKPQGSYCILYL